MPAAESPTSMQRLIAHQYMHRPTAPSTDSASRTHRRRLPFTSLSSQGLCEDGYSAHLYSSVNAVTHQLPRTLGTHYSAAPYHKGMNEFDLQLRREARAAARERGRLHSAPPMPRISTPASSNSAAARTSWSAESKGTPVLPETSCSKVSPVLSSKFLCSGSFENGNRADSTHTGNGASSFLFLTPSNRTFHSQRKAELQSHPSTADSKGVVPAAVPVPCMRYTVKLNSCVVRDDLGADTQRRLHRYLSSTVA